MILRECVLFCYARIIKRKQTVNVHPVNEHLFCTQIFEFIKMCPTNRILL